MSFSVAVSPEQLLAAAEQLQAMGSDCLAGSTATRSEQSDDQPDRDATPLSAATAQLTTGYRAALQQVGGTVAATAEALIATAHDYQHTDEQAAELLRQLIREADDRDG